MWGSKIKCTLNLLTFSISFIFPASPRLEYISKGDGTLIHSCVVTVKKRTGHSGLQTRHFPPIIYQMNITRSHISPMRSSSDFKMVQNLEKSVSKPSLTPQPAGVRLKGSIKGSLAHFKIMGATRGLLLARTTQHYTHT